MRREGKGGRERVAYEDDGHHSEDKEGLSLPGRVYGRFSGIPCFRETRLLLFQIDKAVELCLSAKDDVLGGIRD